MKLINLLKRDFILPIVITLFISIILSIISTILFLNVFFREDLQKKIRLIENKKVGHIMETIQELLYFKFQKIMNSLSMMKMTLAKLNNEISGTSDYLNYLFEKKKLTISEYLINAKYLYENYSDIINDKNKDLSNIAVWFINDTFTENNIKNIKNYRNIKNELTKNRLKLLALSIHLIPIWKTIVQMFNDKKSYEVDLIYLANRKTEVFISYPVLKNNEYFYSLFGNKKNEQFCLNNEMDTPNYFYFFCSDIYLQIQNAIKIDNEITNFISYPYIFSSYKEKKIGITFCIIYKFRNLNFILEKEVSHNDDNNIYICIDFLLSNYFNIFDNFNKHLNGYFYITRVNSLIPLYYPGFNLFNNDYFYDIVRLEFNFNSKYTVQEVTYFNNSIVPILIKKYNLDNIYIPNDNSRVENFQNNMYFYSLNFSTLPNHLMSINYTKGGNYFNYKIFPIFFQGFEKSNYYNNHLLSIIYTVNNTLENNLYNIFSSDVIFITIHYGFIFFLIGTILITFCGQLILIFGKNITRPIKDIQQRIKEDSGNKLNEQNYKQINNNKNKKFNYIALSLNLGLNKQKFFENENSEFNLNNELNKQKDIFMNKPSFQKNNLLNLKYLNKKKKTEEEIQLLDDELEEVIPIKNQEISSKFDLILSLKKVFLFLENPQANYDKNAIINFLSSNEIFNEIQNIFGKQICLSNIGNLNNLSNKYDKSITFLSKSLDIPEKEDLIIEKTRKKKINEYFFHEMNEQKVNNDFKSNKSKFTAIKKNILKQEQKTINQNLTNQNIMSNLEFSRFAKLFYAYHMFFSNLRKIEKILNQIISMTKNKESPLYKSIKQAFIFYYDYYTKKNIHNSSKYEECIQICILKLLEAKDIEKKNEKIIFCLLQQFKFRIEKLKLIVKRQVNHKINEERELKFEYDDNLYSSNNEQTIGFELEMKSCFKSVIRVQRRLKYYIDLIKYKIEPSSDNHFTYENIRTAYKNFLYELKNVHQVNSNSNIYLNYFILNQEYNYLMGKFAKLSGDYSTAIMYYNKVINDKLLISNGKIYVKANQKILNILNFSKYNPDLLNINSNDEKICLKLFETCNNNLNKLNTFFKDMIIILDRTPINNEKKSKIEIQQTKIMKNIFENYLSSEDKFALYTYTKEGYNEHIKKLIPLTFKDSQNYAFISSILDDLYSEALKDKINNENKDNQFYNNIENNIKDNFNDEHYDDLYNDMKMKFPLDTLLKVINEYNNNINESLDNTFREVFIVILTENFQNEVNKKVNKENIKELFKNWNVQNKNKIKKLFIIGTLLQDQSKLKLVKKELKLLNVDNEYLEFENYQEIRKMITRIGILPRQYEYPNEKFDK